MKELKKEFRWFNIMEYEKEENYLSKRHQSRPEIQGVTIQYITANRQPGRGIHAADQIDLEAL